MNKVVSALNNKYIIAVIVALFLLAMFRRFAG